MTLFPTMQLSQVSFKHRPHIAGGEHLGNRPALQKAFRHAKQPNALPGYDPHFKGTGLTWNMVISSKAL